MKKSILTVFFAVVPAAALAGACDDYYNEMEADMKKDGAYSEQAMKIVKDQVAAVPAEQQETFCLAALESFNGATGEDENKK